MTLLEMTSLDISFGELEAADDPNTSTEQRELYGLIGPSGAGKTATFNPLIGVYKPDPGSIVLDGGAITGYKTIGTNRVRIARTFQNIRLFKDLTALDDVRVGLYNSHTYSTVKGILGLPRHSRVEKEMDKKTTELPKVFDLDKESQYPASNPPYGKQRKLETARALVTGSKPLLLDEPTMGMNPNETKGLMDTIRFVRGEFEMTILLIEHDMKLVSSTCEKLTVSNFGQVLVREATSSVPNNPEVIKAYLGEQEGEIDRHDNARSQQFGSIP